MKRLLCNSRRLAPRGIATLEFVLCIVPLLWLASMTAALGFSLLTKLSVTHNVRQDIWKLRDNTANATDTQTLHIDSDAEAGGLFRAPREKNTSLQKVLRGSYKAYSRNPVLTGTWDFREMGEFNETPPHLHALQKMGQADIGLAMFDDLLQFNKFSDWAKQLLGEMQQKKSLLQQKFDEMKKQLDQWKNELNDLENELDHLKAWEIWKAPFLKGEIEVLKKKIDAASEALDYAGQALNDLP